MTRALLLLVLSLLSSVVSADAVLMRAESAIDSDDLEVRRGLAGYRVALRDGREAGVDAWHRGLETTGSDLDGQAIQAVLAGQKWKLAGGVERMDNGWTLPVAEASAVLPWRGNEIEVSAGAGPVETPRAIAAKIDAQMAGVVMTREIGEFTLAGGGHLRRFGDDNARVSGLFKGLWHMPVGQALYLGLRWQGQKDESASLYYFSPERYQRLQLMLLVRGTVRDVARWRIEARSGEEHITPFGVARGETKPSHTVLVEIEAPLAARTRADCSLAWQDAAASEGGYDYTQVACSLRRDF